MFMAITLNFYIEVNKKYLHNYSEKKLKYYCNELENKK